MALMELNVYSDILACQNEMRIFLPGNGEQYQPDKPYKVLWMLHGGNADCHEWLCHTSLFRLAGQSGYAVVLLSTYNSFGMDMARGGKYAGYLEKEVVFKVRRLLPCLSARREDNTACGVSMGGFAAVRWAMNCTDIFSKCAAFAGAMAMPIIYERYKQGTQPGGPDFDHAFGSVARLKNNRNDILYMARRNLADGTMIPIYMICGEDDFGYDLNVYMHKELVKMDADVTFYPVQGIHSFECWEPHLGQFMDWLKRKERG